MRNVMPHIQSTPKRELYVAITGRVFVDGQGLSRSEFIWKCESLTDASGSPAFKICETKAASKLDYVIADTRSDSAKYRLGQQLGNLITAQDFYDMLKNSVRGEVHE